MINQPEANLQDIQRSIGEFRDEVTRFAGNTAVQRALQIEVNNLNRDVIARHEELRDRTLRLRNINNAFQPALLAQLQVRRNELQECMTTLGDLLLDDPAQD